MIFFRRYPRFTFLLSFLLTASLLLLLTHSPFPSLQPSSAPPTQPVNSTTGFQGLAARVRRAERAYQRMLLGRDALIARVGPTPHDVVLCVPHHPFIFFPLISALMTCRFPPDREPWPPYTVCKSSLLLRSTGAHYWNTVRGLFPPRLFLPTRAGTRRRTW